MIPRKYTAPSQSRVHADKSRPQPYEHLMVVFFDILLLDDDACLKLPHRQRRLLLQNVVKKIPGRAALAEQEVLDFGRPDSQHRLAITFSNAIAQRWEGYVLKACEEPYFPMYSAGVDNSFGRWIKLKKDYIPGLGDTVDLALIAASYDAQEAAAIKCSRKLRWTHFFVGCLLNKEQFVEAEAVPQFRVVDVISRHSMHRDILLFLNQYGEFHARDPDGFEGFGFELGNERLRTPSALFKKPFVAEMMGAGFEKPSGARYFTLRFPRILKIHTDRTFEEAASFRELQLLAEDAQSVPVEDMLEEREQWCKRLKIGSGLDQYIVRRSQSPSSRSSSPEPDTHSGSRGSCDSSSPIKPASGSLQYPDHENHHSSQRTSHGRMPNGAEGSPVVYVDQTTCPEPERLHAGDNVLTENANLSCRQSSSQTTHADSQKYQQNENFPELRPQERPSKRNPDGSSNSQPVTGLFSMHRHQIQDATQTGSRLASQGQDVEPLVQTPSSSIPHRSPLTTIPVYLSSAPSTKSSHQEEESANILKFLATLGSSETISSLQQSNPKAFSRGLAFGLALVIPGETPLGQEIHRIAGTLSRMLQDGVSLHSRKGRIFFIDSVILEQDIQPEDLSFCLRETWTDIGRKYYYACLSWDLDDHYGEHLETQKKSYSHLDNECPTPIGERSPALAVTFDEDDILVLGEYKSTEPPLHVDDT